MNMDYNDKMLVVLRWLVVGMVGTATGFELFKNDPKIKKSRDECMKQLNLENSLIQQIDRSDPANAKIYDDEKAKCYVSCVMDRTDLVKRGPPTLDGLKKLLDVKDEKTVVEMAKHCWMESKIKLEKCEGGFILYKCLLAGNNNGPVVDRSAQKYEQKRARSSAGKKDDKNDTEKSEDKKSSDDKNEDNTKDTSDNKMNSDPKKDNNERDNNKDTIKPEDGNKDNKSTDDNKNEDKKTADVNTDVQTDNGNKNDDKKTSDPTKDSKAAANNGEKKSPDTNVDSKNATDPNTVNEKKTNETAPDNKIGMSNGMGNASDNKTMETGGAMTNNTDSSKNDQIVDKNAATTNTDDTKSVQGNQNSNGNSNEPINVSHNGQNMDNSRTNSNIRFIDQQNVGYKISKGELGIPNASPAPPPSWDMRNPPNSGSSINW